MNKASKLSTFLISTIFIVSTAPILAFAGSGGPCPRGQIINAIGSCSTASSFGGGGVNISVLTPYVSGILYTINYMLVPALFTLAFLVFVWGVFKYFFYGADSEEERRKGREFVLWGIIGFVVIFSVWGLVAIVGSTFQISSGGTAPNYPTL